MRNMTLPAFLGDIEVKPVVPFIPGIDSILLFDFSKTNTALETAVSGNTPAFSAYIEQRLSHARARYGIGGYDEERTIYNRSKVFDARKGEEPRRLHLGIDIWSTAGTPVSAPLDGRVHSFAFNDQFGDYGATIILEHLNDESVLYSLYGHLSLRDIAELTEGQFINSGQVFAHFGRPEENGHWPPHLHFQLIWNMEGKKGDYPGVCAMSERDKYLSNCPDPDLMLPMLSYAVA